MSTRSPFDDKYWNLAQAAAWVVYREPRLVDEFQVADRTAYMALGMYPSMWPKGRERQVPVEDLRRALADGCMKSYGYRRNTTGVLEEIPVAEWADLRIIPPLVSVAAQPDNQPWKAVRVLSADMKRMWRDINEVSLRTRFDWPEIRKLYDEVRDQQPEMSKNNLIEELQLLFAERFNKEAPSRSSLQRKIKAW